MGPGLWRAVAFALLWSGCTADVYLHSPRASNNRLNEQNVNRDNNNRLFDSQNNNKGGYSVGVDDDDYADANIPVPNADLPPGYEQLPLQVLEGSDVPIEWTPQHACGPNANTDCEIVIQYLSDAATEPGGAEDFPGDGTAIGGAARLRDGTQTGCNDNNDQCPPLNNDNQANGDTNDAQFGNHEPVMWYLQARQRDNNAQLFTADQNLDGDEAIYTRQNPGGGRSGTEVPEERDYYPYWVPSPFKDIAVLTSDIVNCDLYNTDTQNAVAKGLCMGSPNDATEETCIAGGGTWSLITPWDMAPPDCQEMFWTRDNHLGNAENGYAPVYNWTLPKVSGLASSLSANPASAAGQEADQDAVVIRLRYNITTQDTGEVDVPEYWALDESSNDNQSPVQQDEATTLVADLPEAVDERGQPRTQQLALNTNQYGRVFQDRSYAMWIENEDNQRRRRRLAEAPVGGTTNEDCAGEVHEMHIRGKRGNIVQSYPSVEHDFLPQVLVAETGSCVHLQIQLTDNDPPNNAGEGLPGSGRANMALVAEGDKNTPVESFADQTFFENEAQMFQFAYLGQEDLTRNNNNPSCLSEDTIENNNQEQNVRNCGKLNPIGPNADGGYVKMRTAGTFQFQSTRENNFSNRGQKGVIIVADSITATETIIIIIGLACVGVCILVTMYMGYNNANKPEEERWKAPHIPQAIHMPHVPEGMGATFMGAIHSIEASVGLGGEPAPAPAPGGPPGGKGKGKGGPPRPPPK